MCLSAQPRLAILSKILSFTSEQQRLAYEDTVHPYSLFAILKETEADLALALLRYKSVVLDSIIEDRLVAEASKESKDRDLVGRLAADKRLLGQLLLQSPNRPSTEPNNRIENLACIAHKSSEICERCRLRQQNPAAASLWRGLFQLRGRAVARRAKVASGYAWLRRATRSRSARSRRSG